MTLGPECQGPCTIAQQLDDSAADRLRLVGGELSIVTTPRFTARLKGDSEPSIFSAGRESTYDVGRQPGARDAVRGRIAPLQPSNLVWSHGRRELAGQRGVTSDDSPRSSDLRSSSASRMRCVAQSTPALACGGALHDPAPAPEVGFDRPDILVNLSHEMAGSLATGRTVIPDYAWRLRHLCVISDESRGACSAQDFRDCPEEPGRVIRYLRPREAAVGASRRNRRGRRRSSRGAQPGDASRPMGRQIERGCMDVTALNPPPSPGEVFRYFQRLPLPTLTTQHQPPGNGLSGLPVIFYTDSPTTQTFTVDIRGFSVVIEAEADAVHLAHRRPRDPRRRQYRPRQAVSERDRRARLPLRHLHRLPDRHLGRDLHRQRQRAGRTSRAARRPTARP